MTRCTTSPTRSTAPDSTDPEKLVDALEKTNWQGTVGRIQFFGKDDPSTHAMKYGKDYVSGLFVQWQDGKQVPIWPASVAGSNVLKFPSFVNTTEIPQTLFVNTDELTTSKPMHFAGEQPARPMSGSSSGDRVGQ